MTTLEDIRRLDREVITPQEAADILRCNPQYIRMQARADATKLGFPAICIGCRVKIPRLPFLAAMEGAGGHGQT